MTDRFVYTRAVDALADMEHREVVAQLALDAVRAEKKRLIDFLDLYEHFEARGEVQAGAKGEEPEASASAAPANEADAVGDTASVDQSTAARKDAQAPKAVLDERSSNGRSTATATIAGAAAQTAGTQAPPVDVHSQAKVSTGNGGSNAPLDSAPASGEASRLSGGSGTAAFIPPATVAQTVPANEPVAVSSPAGSDAVAIPATNPPEEAPETTGTDRGAGGSPASQEATGKSAGPSGSAAPTLKELIRPVHLAHPDWTARQIAEHINRPFASVTTILGTVRRELREAAQSPQETEEQPEATDAPEAELDASPTSPEPVAATQPRQLFRRPIYEVGDDGEAEFVPKPRPKPLKQPLFYLRTGRGEGKYLHMSGVGLVPGKTYAWSGTEAQLLKVRQKFPDARDLFEEAVKPEQSRRELPR